MQQENIMKDFHLNRPSSITPSGFFGKSPKNINELENFLTKEENDFLLNFAKNNTLWDFTEDSYDKDGLILYQANIWKDRVCTTETLQKASLNAHEMIAKIYQRLKPIIESFFEVEVQQTFPAIVRWPVGTRQEPHADKEFHIGKEKGRPNEFPHFDIATVIYLNDDYEGGQLYFPMQGYEFTPKSGAAYFFPGDRFYVHGVRPVISGTRYTSPLFWTIKKHTGEKQP